MRVSVEANDIEWLLNEVSGVLATLYQQEANGLALTSIRIEINAMEGVRKRLSQITQASVKQYHDQSFLTRQILKRRGE